MRPNGGIEPTNPGSGGGPEPASEGLGKLFRVRLSARGFPGNQHVRSIPFGAASQTAQPAALPSAGRDELQRPLQETGAGLFISSNRATVLCMPEARVFRRAGCGKSARPVRRGESWPHPNRCRLLSCSTEKFLPFSRLAGKQSQLFQKIFSTPQHTDPKRHISLRTQPARPAFCHRPL